MDSPPPPAKPRLADREIIASVFCLVFAATSLFIFLLDTARMIDGRIWFGLHLSWPWLCFSGSLTAALGGWLILTRRRWGYAPACVGIAAVLPWATFNIPLLQITLLYVIIPGLASLNLVLIQRQQWVKRHRTERLALGREPTPTGRTLGHATLGFGLAGTWLSPFFWSKATALAERSAPDMECLYRVLSSWLYPLLFLTLAVAACLRMDNRRWSLFLIIPGHVLLMALTLFLFGCNALILSVIVYIYSSILLLFAVFDSLN